MEILKKIMHDPGIHKIFDELEEPLSDDIIREASQFNRVISYISEEELNRPFTM